MDLWLTRGAIIDGNFPRFSVGGVGTWAVEMSGLSTPWVIRRAGPDGDPVVPSVRAVDVGEYDVIAQVDDYDGKWIRLDCGFKVLADAPARAAKAGRPIIMGSGSFVSVLRARFYISPYTRSLKKFVNSATISDWHIHRIRQVEDSFSDLVEVKGTPAYKEDMSPGSAYILSATCVPRSAGSALAPESGPCDC